MSKNRNIIFGFILASMAAWQCSLADTIQDDFDGQTKGPNGALDKQPAGGEGGAIWQATANVKVDPVSGLYTTDDGAFVARVAVPEGKNVITVSAEIRPTMNGEKRGWLAVGMGNGPLGNPTFGGIYLVIYPDGIFNLLYNSNPSDYSSASVKTLKNGRIPNFTSEEMVKIQLQFDRNTNTVSASSNDREIVEPLSLSESDSNIEAVYAGVSGYGTPSNKRCVGQFSLNVE